MVFRPPKKSKDVTPSDTSTASDVTDLSEHVLCSFYGAPGPQK